MTLLIDLFPCQTGSRFRGIGRYTLSITQEIARLRQGKDLAILADPLYPESFEELRQLFTRLLPPGAFKPYFHRKVNHFEFDQDAFSQIAQTQVLQAYHHITPQVVLYSSVFEGWREQGVVPLPTIEFPQAVRAAIIYDFIPYIFSDHYLDRDKNYKKWYLQRMESLKRFDVLLAISEATRQDAIRLLGLEADRVVNISSACNPFFRKREYSDNDRREALERFGISRPFIFCTGNEEYHKNIVGVLKAFARLPVEVRAQHQLLVTYPGNISAIKAIASSFGLRDGELILTGHIDDESLIALYNLCCCFVLPSLYEGFGLPVLEAMACGAPVIASNNSSLPEVVGRPDALFDASDGDSMLATLSRVLNDDNFRQDLAGYGLERVKLFSWETTARKALDAIEVICQQSTRDRKKPFKGVRKRIAYLSPLPPQKSGIADYSVDLLHHLKAFFDIDLFVQPENVDPILDEPLAIYPWTDIFERRDLYDTFVYQFGNSEFHTHMTQLLCELPGVVVLHDFYLSNLGYIREFLQGEQGAFLREVERNHGLRGMIFCLLSGVEAARKDLPMNWVVLKHAQEVIVHSKHAQELIEQFYKFGWRPRSEVIRPMRRVIPKITAIQKQTYRKELNLCASDFIFCSFGFMASTKLNLLQIQAFAQHSQGLGDQGLLIFVGEQAGGEYAQEVQELIDHLGIRKRVRITGYVSPDIYRKYLSIADAAIQLRTDSRGETSASVLDCMAYGLPTIVNAHGSLAEYDADALIMLTDPPNIDDLVAAMSRVRNDKSYAAGVGQQAQRYLEVHHDPGQTTLTYASVIDRAARGNERKLFEPLVDALVSLNAGDELVRSVASYAAANLGLRCQPRLLIDVSDIAQTDWRGGIQRVVKSIVREIMRCDNSAWQIELVHIQQGKLVNAYRFAETLFDLPAQSLGNETTILIQPCDSLFMLDSSWSLYHEFIPYFNLVRQAGGKIITNIYDLIPILFPETCHRVVLDVFDVWLNTAISHSDVLVCISRSVADDLIEYIETRKIDFPRPLDIAYYHLGAEIPIDASESLTRREIYEVIGSTNSPVFIMVGTIEPRKGHTFVLDAFEKLWQQKIDSRLCIIGKMGWNVESTMHRICSHPELGKRLFFIENATDAEINFCYRHAQALITASYAEGFGLPIIEAALHHTPTLASDIPVHREVGGEGSLYFSLKSPDNLTGLVQELSSWPEEKRHALASKVHLYSWRESADGLLDIILNNKPVYRTLIPGSHKSKAR